MAVEYRYHPDGTGIELRCSGIVDFRQLHDANEEIYGHEYPGGFRFQLINFVNVAKFDLTAADVRLLAAQDNEHSPKFGAINVALVGSADLIYGFSRLWEGQLTLSSLNTQVFRDLASAFEWLAEQGIDVDPLASE